MIDVSNPGVTQGLKKGERITPEEVAVLSSEDIDEGLRRLGLDPDEPLPDALRDLIGLNPVVSQDEKNEEVVMDAYP
jgi:hypothetical protein